jgi:hypothetical protein
MLNGKQTPRLLIYTIDKILNPILTKDDKDESNAAKQRGYDGVWATHLSDSIHRERRTLLEAGLIDKNVQTGIWKISAKGKTALRNVKKLNEVYSSFDESRLPKIKKMYIDSEKEAKKYADQFDKKTLKTKTTKTVKPKATKKKPGRPKAKKEVKPKQTKPKTKPGRPKGAKNKKAKKSSTKTNKKQKSKDSNNLPVIKRPVTAKKRGRRTGNTQKKMNQESLHKDLQKRKPGRPPKSGTKSKKRSLINEIEQRMAAKDKSTPESTKTENVEKK